jgi:pyridoxal phosphate enzyme (YggS family)
VKLVAITKSSDLADIQSLVELGVTDFGESRVQQLTQRAEELAAWLAEPRSTPLPPVRWHMVGRLQRNKVKACLGAADMVHSIDSLRLAEEISVRAERQGRTLECLMEVNCSGEPQKGGVAIGAAIHLAEQISTLRGIRLVGLMTMAPLNSDPLAARPTFTSLRELSDEMRNEKIGGKTFRHLSMGMSQDFEVAIEEGATMIRVGSLLFD